MKHNFFTPIFLGFLLPFVLPAQGLKFKGSEYPIDERTSYNVFAGNPPTFTGHLTIRFAVLTTEPTHIGYICRIKNKEDNTTYNLFFDSQGDSAIFKFSEEGKSSLITARLSKTEIQTDRWFKIEIVFGLKDQTLAVNFNGRNYQTGKVRLPGKFIPLIYFGKSEYVIDVPSFAMRDLIIEDGARKYVLPLRENQGGIVYSQDRKPIGRVENPVWLINEAYYWTRKAAFRSETVAGTNFDPLTREILFFNKDSIVLYNTRTGRRRSEIYADKCPMDLVLGTSFVDNSSNRLYVYEVNRQSEKGVMAAAMDLSDYTWAPVSYRSLPMQLHHHDGYFDQKNRRYTIFGGFGNMHYSRNFYSYSLDDNEWDTLAFSGDRIAPRYFSSMGYLDAAKSLYIFGGMGNESGDQVVGRRYFYDLYKVDLAERRIKKLWEIPWNKENMVPVRQMIVLDSCFYTLCYPEHFSDSFLKLYRFSLKDGTWEVLGDSIPVHSDKIKTNANLYYDSMFNALYAVVQEFSDDDTASEAKIYSLSFPPVTREELFRYTAAKPGNYKWYLVAFGVCLLAGTAYYVITRRAKKRQEETSFLENGSVGKPDTDRIERHDQPNAVYLFGEFTVRNRKGRDISYMFSAKLKQAFLIILEHSLDEGIPSPRLSELLWPDKPEDKVKNSRGVTINHLRKILSELDGIRLVYVKGLFRIECTDECYCDCIRCLEIISSGNSIAYSHELAEILNRGKFLKSADLPLFDSFKTLVERRIGPVLLVEMEKSLSAGLYSTTVSFAEALLHADPTSEDAINYMIRALIKLKKPEEAKKRYLLFTAEYRSMMGTEYPHSFSGLSHKITI